MRLKMLHHGKPVTIDRAFWSRRISAALARRQPLVDRGDTTGYRCVNGENDGMPGLVLDRYDRTLVLKLYSAAWVPHLADLVPAIDDLLHPEALVLRLARNIPAEALARAGGGRRAHRHSSRRAGAVPGVRAHVRGRRGARPEDGPLPRPARQPRVPRARLVEGARVLDMFASTGGFTVHAAAGGATEVTAVDLSEPTLAVAERNLALNAKPAGGGGLHLPPGGGRRVPRDGPPGAPAARSSTWSSSTRRRSPSASTRVDRALARLREAHRPRRPPGGARRAAGAVLVQQPGHRRPVPRHRRPRRGARRPPAGRAPPHRPRDRPPGHVPGGRIPEGRVRPRALSNGRLSTDEHAGRPGTPGRGRRGTRRPRGRWAGWKGRVCPMDTAKACWPCTTTVSCSSPQPCRTTWCRCHSHRSRRSISRRSCALRGHWRRNRRHWLRIRWQTGTGVATMGVVVPDPARWAQGLTHLDGRGTTE